MENVYSEYAFIRGKVVPTGKAVIPVTSRAAQYGIGLFSGMRGYFDARRKSIVVFRMSDHYRRMFESLKILNAELPYDMDDVVRITEKLLRKNRPDRNMYLRPYFYDASTAVAPVTSLKSAFDFALYMLPMNDYVSTTKGLSMSVSSWRRNADNAIPARGKISGGYVNTVIAKHDAVRTGHDGAIFLSEQGNVVEGSSENIFIVRNGALVTPPVSDDILEGITRRTVMELARDSGLQVIERTVDRSELYVAEEVFLTGTAVQLAWVQNIDGRTVGTGRIGPVTQRLQKSFFDVAYGRDERYAHLVTVIPCP